MRKALPVLLAGFVVGLATLATAYLTAYTSQRRSIVLLLLAIGLALPASAVARRKLGVGAALAVWIGVLPLAGAIRRVMGRHVDAVASMHKLGLWRRDAALARGAVEWRVDAPLLEGMWRMPMFVAIAWAVVAVVAAAIVTVVMRSRFHAKAAQSIVIAAWVASLGALALSATAIVRELDRTDALGWARALPTVPVPEQLGRLPACGQPNDGEQITLHGAEFDVEYHPLGCVVRLSRHDARSEGLSTFGLEKLTLHHDPQLDVDVAATPDVVSIFHRPNEPPKVAPISTIPRVHRLSGAATSVLALALLSWRRRSAGVQVARRHFLPSSRSLPTPAPESGPYRSARSNDPLRDDDRVLRAAIALALAVLGAAPLFALFAGGVG